MESEKGTIQMTLEKQKERMQENPQENSGQSPQAPSSSQPKRKRRARPGTKGEGDYYRITVRPKEEFISFRTQDVGGKGHIQRLTGKRSSGSWDTHVWLISKEDAHIEGNSLIPDSDEAKSLMEGLGSKPKHVKEDTFEAKDNPNVPESEKPTEAQQQARSENIKKAQQSRQSRGAKKA